MDKSAKETVRERLEKTQEMVVIMRKMMSMYRPPIKIMVDNWPRTMIYFYDKLVESEKSINDLIDDVPKEK
jgi:hypothetical protein